MVVRTPDCQINARARARVCVCVCVPKINKTTPWCMACYNFIPNYSRPWVPLVYLAAESTRVLAAERLDYLEGYGSLRNARMMMSRT